MARGRAGDDASRSKHREASTLRALRGLALAVLTALVCAMGAGSTGAVPAAGAAVPSAVAAASALGLAYGPRPEPAQELRNVGAPPDVDLEANELDDEDDDDDSSGGGAGDSAAPSIGRVVGPRRAGVAWRRTSAVDTSRFVLEAGLARGPPVA